MEEHKVNFWVSFFAVGRQKVIDIWLIMKMSFFS